MSISSGRTTRKVKFHYFIQLLENDAVPGEFSGTVTVDIMEQLHELDYMLAAERAIGRIAKNNPEFQSPWEREIHMRVGVRAIVDEPWREYMAEVSASLTIKENKA